MKGIPRRRYTKEFREEAVKLVTEEKMSLPEAARCCQSAKVSITLEPNTLVCSRGAKKPPEGVVVVSPVLDCLRSYLLSAL
jgi:hypothetical protein